MNEYVTSHTLLSRALDNKDPNAWEQFAERYQNYIFKLLINLGLKNELEDVAQEIMLVLWKKLDTYDRERSKFRTWMASVVHFTAMNSIRKNSRKDKVFASYDADSLNNFPDEESFMATAEDEWKDFIVDKALENIQSEFRGRAIEVFKLSLLGTEAQEISEQLGLAIATIYSFKKRVKKRLMQEIYFLQKDME